jgi:hypothetical protein
VRRRSFSVVAITLLGITALLGAVGLPGPASAQNNASGVLTVSIVTPDGVPANVTVRSTDTSILVPKPAAGSSTSQSLTLAADTYQVSAPMVPYEGALYRATTPWRTVHVRAGEASAVTLTYQLTPGARDLHVTNLTQSSVSLAWAPGEASSFTLLRITGSLPDWPTRAGFDDISSYPAATFVPVIGTTATDSGLQAGTKYTYILFSRVGGHWVGFMPLTVSTAPSAGTNQASYVPTPGALIATAADIVSATPTGDGVELVLSPNVTAPLIGAGVVLPISDALPGGFLGTVDQIAPDGRTLELTAGGLADAFDYYSLAVTSFSTDSTLLPEPVPTADEPADPADPVTPPAAGAKSATAPAAPRSTGRPGITMTPQPKALAAPSVSCGQLSASDKVVFTPSLALGGHFSTKVDKHGIFGVDIPVGASLDMALTAKATGALSLKTTGSVGCQIVLPRITEQLSVAPVPMAAVLQPSATVTIGTAAEISNVGVSVTGGFAVKAGISVAHGVSASGSLLLNATPLTPQVTGAAQVEVKLAGQVSVGPGVVTAGAGVIAGLKGEWDPLDGVFKPYFPSNNPNYNGCTEISAAMNLFAGLTAKAWIGKWSAQADFTISALNGHFNYPGSPWDFPNGCNIATTPPDSLFGTGVTKGQEISTGGPTQSGYVTGFAPGKNTWVLSTGNIADAVGDPSTLASTPLGLPGDDQLSALSGNPTYDAVSYQVSVVPAGPTLHVRYAFATEEFPDYVGTQYDDVMAVYVNGVNCATVPGTSSPVSVNTINTTTNSQYFVDNRTGATGYHTTMNGITVPLTCSVPVTPGQPVTIRIAVADSSDGVLDSAVALIDGGIWSD